MACLATTHGETLALLVATRAASEHSTGRRQVLPSDWTRDAAGPYGAHAEGHLAWWLGDALAHIRNPTAVLVLVEALRVHDDEFTRAETPLRIDLIFAYLPAGDAESATAPPQDATMIADAVGSLRQRGTADWHPGSLLEMSDRSVVGGGVDAH